MRQFQKCWRPTVEAAAFTDVQMFLNKKMSDFPIDNKLTKLIQRPGLTDAYEAVKRKIRYGAATWQLLHNRLTAIKDQFSNGSDRWAEVRIIDDFLDDLNRRIGQFQPIASIQTAQVQGDKI